MRKKCRKCGRPLPRKRKSYCSDACRFLKLPVRPCLNCGKGVARRDGGGYVGKKFCDVDCRTAFYVRTRRRRPVRMVNCTGCGKEFPARGGHNEGKKTFCSDECKPRLFSDWGRRELAVRLNPGLEEVAAALREKWLAERASGPAPASASGGPTASRTTGGA